MNWKEVKKIVTEDTGTSLQGYMNKYKKLDALGVFNTSRWWIRYEEEMFNLGLTWEECYAHFPLTIKFLLDLSRGHEGIEKFKVNRELSLMFNEILYNRKDEDGYRRDLTEAEIKDMAGKNKQLKFIQCIFEMCGLALEPKKEFQKMYSLIGAGRRW